MWQPIYKLTWWLTGQSHYYYHLTCFPGFILLWFPKETLYYPQWSFLKQLRDLATLDNKPQELQIFNFKTWADMIAWQKLWGVSSVWLECTNKKVQTHISAGERPTDTLNIIMTTFTCTWAGIGKSNQCIMQVNGVPSLRNWTIWANMTNDNLDNRRSDLYFLLLQPVCRLFSFLSHSSSSASIFILCIVDNLFLISAHSPLVKYTFPFHLQLFLYYCPLPSIPPGLFAGSFFIPMLFVFHFYATPFFTPNTIFKLCMKTRWRNFNHATDGQLLIYVFILQLVH